MSRELLQQALDALLWTREHHKLHSNKALEAIHAIEAELARHEWVKFADALPVVPEGKFSVHIWCWRDGQKGKPYTSNFWAVGFERHTSAATHWMYRQDDTPQPPRSEA